MKIRVVKPDAIRVSLLFINRKDHNLYWHEEDTIEVNLDEACAKCPYSGDKCDVCRYIWKFLETKLEGK